ncbi:MAG: YfhO family protein [Ruminococcus sp.]|nr:YfhO family protein [Ruminococcus sp.]
MEDKKNNLTETENTEETAVSENMTEMTDVTETADVTDIPAPADGMTEETVFETPDNPGTPEITDNEAIPGGLAVSVIPEDTSDTAFAAETSPDDISRYAGELPEYSGNEEKAPEKFGGLVTQKVNVKIIDGGASGENVKDEPEKIPLKKRITGFIKAHRHYILVFLLPALILFGAYAAFRVYPFGDMSVLVLDLSGQYVYYFENLRDIVHGVGSPFISWSRNLSGEIMGIYAYYLASPFTVIPMIMPRSMITEALLIMQLCKVGTAAVTFFFYLNRSKGCRRGTCMLFSLLYSLMGYMIVQLMNPMWLDGLIYLPLIVYGIEKIIDDNRWLGFIIPLGLMFMANFYIGWMIAFFCVIYFLYYYFAGKKNYVHSFKSFFFAGIKFASGGVIAAAMAAWVLIPLYYSLKLGKFEFSKPDYTLKTQFEFLDFFKNLLPNVYDTCRPEGSPVIYCGVLTVILLPLFFLNSKVRFRQKTGLGAVLLTLAGSMYLSTVDLAWHGFQVPNWLPYRYSFMFSFILLIMAALTFERLEGITVKELMGSGFALAFYALYISKQGFDGVNIWLSAWYCVGFTLIYSVILRFIKLSGRAARRTLTLIMGIFIVGELFSSSLANMYAIHKDVTYSKYSSYNRYITLGRDTVSKIYNSDPFEESGFYRIEKNHHRTVNDAMAFGNFGISHSSSTLNAAPIQFLRKLGFSYGGHYIKYRGSTYVTDALLGIKYVMEKAEKPQPDEDGVVPADATVDIPENKSYTDLLLTNEDAKDIFAVYENPNAMPLGFMSDNAILDVTLGLDDPFANQNRILSAMISDEYVEYFKEIPVKRVVPENAVKSSYGVHTKYVPEVQGKNSHIEFFIEAPNSNMLYFYMPSSYEREVNLWLNKDFLDYYFEQGKMTVETLGRFTAGEEISLIATITEKKNEVLYKDVLFEYLDEELFAEALDTIKAQGTLELSRWSEDHIRGTINAQKDGIMFTTISWEPGWTVKVDGVETEPVEVCDALIGVPLTAGQHEIEMTFFPEGLAVGIICTISGILSVIIIGISERGDSREKEKAKTEAAA